MNKNLFFLAAFFYTSFVFGQDSADKKAVAKQNNLNSTSSTATNSDKSSLNQSSRDAVSVNFTDTISRQTTGDYKDKGRIISKNEVKDGPK